MRVAVSGSGNVAQYADESDGLWRYARGYRVGFERNGGPFDSGFTPSWRVCEIKTSRIDGRVADYAVSLKAKNIARPAGDTGGYRLPCATQNGNWTLTPLACLPNAGAMA